MQALAEVSGCLQQYTTHGNILGFAGHLSACLIQLVAVLDHVEQPAEDVRSLLEAARCAAAT